MGSKKSQTTQTEQKVEPWSAAKPYFNDLYSTANEIALKNANTPYTGQLYAAPTAAQLAAVDQYKQMAADPRVNAGQSIGWNGAQALNTLAQDTLSGKYMSPDSNPYLAAAVEAAKRPLEQNLTRNILPSIQDQSILQGAYGGSGLGTAQSLAISDFTQQALDVANRMYADNYARERAYQQNAGQLLAQAMGLQQAGTDAGLTGATLLGQAGAQEQAWQQAALNADLQKYLLNQQMPLENLTNLANILTAGGYNQSQGTQTTTVKTSAMDNILRGAAGVAGLAGAGLIPGAGALLGGLGGLFGGGLAVDAASLASRSALGGLAGDLAFGVR